MEAFENAIKVDLAIGGSTNAPLSFAIANEFGLKLKLDMLGKYSRRIP